jgi:c-di-GMP-binding flagellar brake protein YcgR
MKYAELKVGLKLEIHVLAHDGNKINLPFVSELEWVEGDDILTIAAPIYEGRVYPIQVGKVIAISFIGNSNFYEFTAKVIARESKDNLALLKIQALSEISKIQRREFFRFEVNLPVNYRIVESANGRSNQEYIETITRDISGGGLCIRLIEPVEIDKYIECELILSSKVKFIGKVVRLTTYDTLHGPYKYEIGVSFESIDEPMREKIISYIFQEQRRLLKKG